MKLKYERLEARFNEDSLLELTPDLVGATETKNSGIIGETVDLSLYHTKDVRPSQVLYELVSHLVLTKWRDSDGDPKLHLFGQLKRITRQWLDGYLICRGGTYPAQLKYKMLADMACERITAGITRAFADERPIMAVLDPYNPTGSTAHVNFNTSKTDRWETDSRRCHVNWVILDSDWEAEFCRVAESHPLVLSYIKNHNLGFEVPYRHGSEMRTYRPDFIVLIDDGHGDDDPLHLIVEIKGYRREDAREKKATMDTYWVPGVNNLINQGRWAFAEFTEVYQIEADFKEKVRSQFGKIIISVTTGSNSSRMDNIKRAASYITQQLGMDTKWVRINNAIWIEIGSAPDRVFCLADVNAVAKKILCDPYDVLAVLALLSRRSVQLLKMEFRSDSGGGSEIPPAEFIEKLTEWWKEKSITEDVWRDWSSKVQVRWIVSPEVNVHT